MIESEPDPIPCPPMPARVARRMYLHRREMGEMVSVREGCKSMYPPLTEAERAELYGTGSHAKRLLMRCLRVLRRLCCRHDRCEKL